MAAALVRAGIKGIERAGEAGQGDRTMLDALVPLLEALQSAAQRGEPKLMAAKVGRAGWIADRAKGNVDAGAHAVAVVAAAVARAIS